MIETGIGGEQNTDLVGDLAFTVPGPRCFKCACFHPLGGLCMNYEMPTLANLRAAECPAYREQAAAGRMD